MRIKIKTDKIKKFFKQFPWFLGQRAFLSFLILLLLGLGGGVLLFYKYKMLIEEKQPSITVPQLKFKEKDYQEVLEVWQEKEKRLKEIEQKEYSELFR